MLACFNIILACMKRVLDKWTCIISSAPTITLLKIKARPGCTKPWSSQTGFLEKIETNFQEKSSNRLFKGGSKAVHFKNNFLRHLVESFRGTRMIISI